MKHGATDTTIRKTALAELESMVPHGSQVLKTGEEIPEKHWVYKLAKRYFYNDFGTYKELDANSKPK